MILEEILENMILQEHRLSKEQFRKGDDEGGKAHRYCASVLIGLRYKLDEEDML